jgi:hypothetical protein
MADRTLQSQRHPLPGQRQSGADHVVAEADVARGVHGPLDLGHVSGCRGQRRRPGGPGSGGGEAGQVAGVEAGRQGLDPVAAEQDVDLADGSRSSSDKTRLIPSGLTHADIGI